MEQQGETAEEIRLSKYFPYLGSFIIFLGVTRLMLFYYAFGIPILDYLDFTEIITSFFDIILLAVVFLAFTLIQGLLLHDKSEIIADKKISNELLEENNFLIRFGLYVIYNKTLLITGAFLTLSFAIWNLIAKIMSWKYLLIFASIFFLSFWIMIIPLEMHRKHQILNSSTGTKRLLSILFNTILFVFVVFVIASMQARAIKLEKTTYGSMIALENNEFLVSDSTNYYIGKTSNYVFFHHEETNSTDAIPISSVKRITLVHPKKKQEKTPWPLSLIDRLLERIN